MPEVLDNYDFMDIRYARKSDKIYTSVPMDSEGDDGEMRIVQDRNEYALYLKSAGRWFLFRHDGQKPTAGNMYTDDSTINVTITTNGTYYDVTPFEGSEVTGGVRWITDYLLIPTTGWYNLEHHGSFDGTASVTYHISLFNGPTKISNLSVERKIGTGNDIGAYGAGGLAYLTVGSKINMKVTASSSGSAFNLNHGGVSVTLL
jgi:hypothetical protein